MEQDLYQLMTATQKLQQWQQVWEILLLYLLRRLILILTVMITEMNPTMIHSQVDPKTYNLYCLFYNSYIYIY